jgi:hypothetical protein
LEKTIEGGEGMNETRITGTIQVGEEEVKLAVHDNRYADPKQRWSQIHSYFLSLELQTVEKLGIPMSVYREFLESQEMKHEFNLEEV